MSTETEEEVIVTDAPEIEGEKEVTIEEGVEELKARLDAANKRAAEADAARRAAEVEAHGAKTAVQETNLQLVSNAIDTLRQSNEIAKANYRAAMQAGDFDAAGTYQQEMAEHAAKLLQLENGKQAMEAAPLPAAPVARPPADPVEAFAVQLSPRSADWVRRHPEYVTDQRLNQKMIGAHNMAIADGHVADSEAYFEAVESLLGVRKAPTRSADPPARSVAPAAAPVSRETRGNVVRLTAEEREIAAMNKMTPEEYAKAKLDLKKEGRLH
jgi:hypothetical protein